MADKQYRCDRCGLVRDEPFECFGIEAMVSEDHRQTTLHGPMIASEWEAPEGEPIDDVGGDFALSTSEE
jgi:hypothetical protein